MRNTSNGLPINYFRCTGSAYETLIRKRAIAKAEEKLAPSRARVALHVTLWHGCCIICLPPEVEFFSNWRSDIGRSINDTDNHGELEILQIYATSSGGAVLDAKVPYHGYVYVFFFANTVVRDAKSAGHVSATLNLTRASRLHFMHA